MLNVRLASFILACVVGSFISHSLLSHALADDVPGQRTPKEWVERLDAPTFATRREAARELGELGLEAIDALSEGAQSPSNEVAERCFELLTKHFESGTQNVRQAAEQTLQKLAKNPSEGIANRARNVLAPKPAEANMPRNAPAPIRFQQRIAIQVLNGKQKKIEIERNGKKVVIRIDGDKHTVERPGNAASKPPVEYENEQALEKGDPEAHRLLKQFGQIRMLGPGQANGAQGRKLQAGGLRLQLNGRFPNIILNRKRRPEAAPEAEAAPSTPAEPGPEPDTTDV